MSKKTKYTAEEKYEILKISENTIESLQGFLKRIRTAAGISQKALAEQSGVTLRSIQMYEQKRI